MNLSGNTAFGLRPKARERPNTSARHRPRNPSDSLWNGLYTVTILNTGSRSNRRETRCAGSENSATDHRHETIFLILRGKVPTIEVFLK